MVDLIANRNQIETLRIRRSSMGNTLVEVAPLAQHTLLTEHARCTGASPTRPVWAEPSRCTERPPCRRGPFTEEPPTAAASQRRHQQGASPPPQVCLVSSSPTEGHRSCSPQEAEAGRTLCVAACRRLARGKFFKHRFKCCRCQRGCSALMCVGAALPPQERVTGVSC